MKFLLFQFSSFTTSVAMFILCPSYGLERKERKKDEEGRDYCKVQIMRCNLITKQDRERIIVPLDQGPGKLKST